MHLHAGTIKTSSSVFTSEPFSVCDIKVVKKGGEAENAPTYHNYTSNNNIIMPE